MLKLLSPLLVIAKELVGCAAVRVPALFENPVPLGTLPNVPEPNGLVDVCADEDPNKDPPELGHADVDFDGAGADA